MDNIIIGKGTTFNGNKKLIASKNSKIIIGKYCAIANGLIINTLNHDYYYPAIQGKFYKNFFNDLHPGEKNNNPSLVRTKGDVKIGNNVWIAEDVWIGSGVNIGDGAIIGAKSVVTKNVEPYCLYCGNPAIFKKKLFDDDKIYFLLELKWWNWDDDKIKKNKLFFNTNLNNYEIKEIKNIII